MSLYPAKDPAVKLKHKEDKCFNQSYNKSVSRRVVGKHWSAGSWCMCKVSSQVFDESPSCVLTTENANCEISANSTLWMLRMHKPSPFVSNKFTEQDFIKGESSY